MSKATYIITGKDRKGKRFRIEVNSYIQVATYNIWQGNIWILLDNNKRKLVKRIIN